MKILFWLRKSKINSKGDSPIYCRITINGMRCKDFSTGISVQTRIWNAKMQRSENELINSKLRHIHHKLDLIFIQLENSGQVPDPEVIRSIYQQKTHFSPTMVQVCEKYEQHVSNQVKTKTLRPRTLKRYQNFSKSIYGFLRSINNVQLQAEQFNVLKATAFVDYCQVKLGHGIDHSNRMANIARIILQWSMTQGLIKSNPLFQWKGESGKPKEIIYLLPEQLKQINSTVFTRESLQRTADLFLFQCFTGLDYGDTQTFVPAEHIRKDPQGRYWIVKHRQKNGSKAALPLFNEAIQILSKYQGEDLLGEICRLPRFSNQKYNERLKELACYTGLDIHLTSHVGRKTFGMIALNAGYSIEAVSAMLGHRYIATTQRHYARVLEGRVAIEFRNQLLSNV